ncbi:hypothetical protein SLS60_001611 [Paraconiothyrium brasiliense]|uniref:Uncharacterized protein n=1 Tax=Paraconiothyrium brasiliense TaxID=300254 RepID=A0ABR3RZU4_9PLEO
MPEQRRKIKLGSPEFRELMAKKTAIAAAAASSTILLPAPVVNDASAPTTGILAQVSAGIPPDTLKATRAPGCAPDSSPNSVLSSMLTSMPTTPPDVSATQSDKPADNTRESDWRDSTRKEVARHNSKLFPANFGFVLSDQLPFGVSSSGNGPYYSAIRIFPSIDGTYRSANAEVQRKPSWGAASKPSSKIASWRIEPRPAYEPPTRSCEATACHFHIDEPHQETTEHLVSAVQLELNRPPVSVTQRRGNVQHREQPFQKDHKTSEAEEIPTAPAPTPLPARQIVQEHPSHSPRLVYQPVHLRYFHTYGALNSGTPTLERYLDGLRDELTIRGLPFPKTKNWKELASILADNDEEWWKQLLTLEREVLSKLCGKEKVDAFMHTQPFKIQGYFDYGDLEVELIHHYRGTAEFSELMTKVRDLQSTAYDMLLHIANHEYVSLGTKTPDFHPGIARRIADFRARKIATEGCPLTQPGENYTLDRGTISTPERSDTAPAGSQWRKRRRDQESERDDETRPANKKPRQDVAPVPVAKVSAAVQVESATVLSPEQSTLSIPASQSSININSDSPPRRRGTKRHRDTEEVQGLDTAKKRLRYDVTQIEKASASAQVATTPGATSQQSEISTSAKQSQIDGKSGSFPKLQGAKRHRLEAEPTETNAQQDAANVEEAFATVSSNGGNSQQKEVSDSSHEGKIRIPPQSPLDEARGPSESDTPTEDQDFLQTRSIKRNLRSNKRKEPEPEYVWEQEEEDLSNFIDDGDEDEPVRTPKRRRRSSEGKKGFDRGKFRRMTNLIKD